MPGLLTHHLLAGALADDLKGTVFEEPLDHCPEYLYLGAVFHDALFYVSSREKGARFKRQGTRLHGLKGEDTLFLPRGLLREAAGEGRSGPEREPLLAFTAGLISHIAADTVFHPFVFYFSGPLSAPLTKLGHRRLETLMDLFFSRGQTRPVLLRSHLRRAGQGATKVFALAGRCLVGEEEAVPFSRTMVRALTRMGRTQVLFQTRPLAWLLFSLNPLLPRAVKEAIALAQAPQLGKYLTRLEGRHSYLHPVSGDREEAGLEELFVRAAARTVSLARELVASLEKGENGDQGSIGPSLSTGLVGPDEGRMVHFSPVRLVGP